MSRNGQGHLTSLVRLSLLAPDIVRALLKGREPIELTPTRLLRLSKDLPHDWIERDKSRHLPLSRTLGVKGDAYFLAIAPSCRRLTLASNSSRRKRFVEGFSVCGRVPPAGVVISAFVVGAGMMHFLGWPAAPALVFSVLIAATDPIAVIAMFKDTGIKGRLRLLVESESLFNDGVAAVLFALALTWAQAADGGAITAAIVARELALIAGGGVFVGIAAGRAAIVLAGRTSDHLVETALTVVAALSATSLRRAEL